MSRRLTRAILRLYPRRVRQRHGPEIMALIDDLIAHDGRSRAGLLIHLAVDGLGQRIASTATVWTMGAVLAATSVGGLAVSDFADASAHQDVSHTVRTLAPARHTRQTPHHQPRWRRSLRRARMIARGSASSRSNRHGDPVRCECRAASEPLATAAAVGQPQPRRGARILLPRSMQLSVGAAAKSA